MTFRVIIISVRLEGGMRVLHLMVIGVLMVGSPGYCWADGDRDDAKQVARDTGRAVKETAKKSGRATRDGAKAVGHSVRDTAKGVGRAVRDAVKD